MTIELWIRLIISCICSHFPEREGSLATSDQWTEGAFRSGGEWSNRHVVAKVWLSRVDFETILRIGGYWNALFERHGWEKRHTAGEYMLIEEAMQKARRRWLWIQKPRQL